MTHFGIERIEFAPLVTKRNLKTQILYRNNRYNPPPGIVSQDFFSFETSSGFEKFIIRNEM